MAALECSISGLSTLDTGDLEAVMRMNEACLGMLLDPSLWAWMIGLTLVSLVGGALIGWMKGRVLAGVIWAALLGPIGWIVVALGKSKLPVCSECSKKNFLNATICRHCGANLRQSAQRTARSRMKAADNSHRG